VNIPVGAIAAFCAYTFVKETPKEAKGKPVDWWGIALLAIAVGSLQTILEKGEIGRLVCQKHTNFVF